MERCFGGLENLVNARRQSTPTPQIQDQDDEDVMFGKIVTMKLKQIKDGEQKLEMRYKIERMLQAEIRKQQEEASSACLFRPF